MQLQRARGSAQVTIDMMYHSTTRSTRSTVTDAASCSEKHHVVIVEPTPASHNHLNTKPLGTTSTINKFTQRPSLQEAAPGSKTVEIQTSPSVMARWMRTRMIELATRRWGTCLHAQHARQAIRKRRAVCRHLHAQGGCTIHNSYTETPPVGAKPGGFRTRICGTRLLPK